MSEFVKIHYSTQLNYYQLISYEFTEPITGYDELSGLYYSNKYESLVYHTEYDKGHFVIIHIPTYTEFMKTHKLLYPSVNDLIIPIVKNINRQIKINKLLNDRIDTNRN